MGKRTDAGANGQEQTELNVPRHVAFIMDGNGRWAQKRGMPREYGHKRGAEVFRKIVSHCADIGISFVTVYAFSTENWKRPQNEVNELMHLLEEYLELFLRDLEKNDLSIRFIGDEAPLSETLKEKMHRVAEKSAGRSHVLNLALNYGGRDEIVHACKKLMNEGVKDPTAADLSAAMYTAGSPDPDLIVRTGGEQRLSNFLLWQAAYAELYFTDVLWPDLTNEDVDEAIKCFNQRHRRFGAV